MERGRPCAACGARPHAARMFQFNDTGRPADDGTKQKLICLSGSDALVRASVIVACQLLALAILVRYTAGPALSAPSVAVGRPATVLVSASGHSATTAVTLATPPSSVSAPLWRAAP